MFVALCLSFPAPAVTNQEKEPGFELSNKSSDKSSIYAVVINDFWAYAPVESLERNKKVKGAQALLNRPNNNYIGDKNGKLIWTQAEEIKPGGRMSRQIKTDRETYLILYKTKPKHVAIKVDVNRREQGLDTPAGTLTDPEPFACYWFATAANRNTIYVKYDTQGDFVHPQEGKVFAKMVGKKVNESGYSLANNVTPQQIEKGPNRAKGISCGTFRVDPSLIPVAGGPEPKPQQATPGRVDAPKPQQAVIGVVKLPEPQRARIVKNLDFTDQFLIQAATMKTPDASAQRILEAAKKLADAVKAMSESASAGKAKTPDIIDQVLIDANKVSAGPGSSKRLLEAAKKLADATAQMVKSAEINAVDAKLPSGQTSQQRIADAAKKVAEATAKMLSAPPVKK